MNKNDYLKNQIMTYMGNKRKFLPSSKGYTPVETIGNHPIYETTSLEDTDRTIVQGVRSYSGSARLFYYQASAAAGGDVSDLIAKCIKAGSSAGDGTADASTAATLKLKIVDGSANGRFITFSTLITGISMNSAVGEVLSADISWESNGAPTEVSI